MSRSLSGHCRPMRWWRRFGARRTVWRLLTARDNLRPPLTMEQPLRKKEVPPVAGARRRYFEAWKVRREAEATGDEPARRKGNRMLWQATSDALKAYAHPSNTEPFPPEMAFDIHVVLEDFLGGHPSPELVDDLATRGPGKSYLLREHIRLAAAYISAADRGEIPDATPKETIEGGMELRQIHRETG